MGEATFDMTRDPDPRGQALCRARARRAAVARACLPGMAVAGAYGLFFGWTYTGGAGVDVRCAVAVWALTFVPSTLAVALRIPALGTIHFYGGVVALALNIVLFLLRLFAPVVAALAAVYALCELDQVAHPLGIALIALLLASPLLVIAYLLTMSLRIARLRRGRRDD